ncbi:hypothetical protein OOU_Y34scaffold00460g4 [Pyricularia oryzae Y34]|uniref:Uncharacterized protein n=1 Tax=Pyricularia oryzae (strain Y34) TaxID=1143189 RepID=A0AA97P1E1_PYRO3|nr:hypothetical protein OOU_Y34scaffold00460g4 [Pyricularia oryzae Y34]
MPIPKPPQTPGHNSAAIHAHRLPATGNGTEEVSKEYHNTVELNTEAYEGPPHEDHKKPQEEGSRALGLLLACKEEQSLLWTNDYRQADEEEYLFSGRVPQRQSLKSMVPGRGGDEFQTYIARSKNSITPPIRKKPPAQCQSGRVSCCNPVWRLPGHDNRSGMGHQSMCVHTARTEGDPDLCDKPLANLSKAREQYAVRQLVANLGEKSAG